MITSIFLNEETFCIKRDEYSRINMLNTLNTKIFVFNRAYTKKNWWKIFWKKSLSNIFFELIFKFFNKF